MNFHNRIFHEAVMFSEVMEYLQPLPGKSFIDCTLGDGGHTLGLLEKGCKVLGLEVYDDALKRATERITTAGYANSFIGYKGNFKNILSIANEVGWSLVDGILFDLGYSSFELDDSDLGLSFLKDDPLDMRMSSELTVTAADLVNKLPEKELAQMFFVYGGERMANRFASEIVKARGMKQLLTTRQLADLLKSVATPGYEHGRIHPATRVFQALRITVNDDLENLKISLPRAASLLLPGGRMAIISFHSLEDQIAKQFGVGLQPTLKAVVKKPLVPTQDEISKNSRARSAKLRIYERV